MIAIGEAAHITGVHAQTLRKWEREGKIIAHKTPGGQRRYDISEINRFIKTPNKNRRSYIYCRVSSRKQTEDLQRQIEYMQQLYPGYEVVSDISSGMHYNRPGIEQVLELIIGGSVERIAVSYKDRLGRFGFDLFEKIAKCFGTEIIIVNTVNKEPSEEISEDIIAIITSFAAKIHGKRKYRSGHEISDLFSESDESDTSNI